MAVRRCRAPPSSLLLRGAVVGGGRSAVGGRRTMEQPLTLSRVPGRASACSLSRNVSAGPAGPSSPSTWRGCMRSSTASPPTWTNSPGPGGRGSGHRRGAPRPAGGTPSAAGRAGPGVPGLLRPQEIARLIDPATGAGLGRLAGRAIPARQDRPAAGLHRQPVPAALTPARMPACPRSGNWTPQRRSWLDCYRHP